VLAGLTVAVVIALAWYVLDARERSIITGATESTIRGVETLIKLDIEARVVSLSGLARQLGGETSISRDDWENLARIIYLGRPGYQSIGLIHRSMFAGCYHLRVMKSRGVLIFDSIRPLWRQQ